ncbi:hypothetical protein DSCA_12010 [Desulfosarcina alkanivorans]|uniref:Uncharacterized protein n=1 Tax=Desulfosarcina alkanivorans TaxID=571177 RepID=A0A5K7YKE3_9BACT|nr:HAD family hydrolase [Desulfosarcina alkanivorans]BBO67271.1 hypothetical protein DSCA_12010 [Desulfosarcina alkanivorans]
MQIQDDLINYEKIKLIIWDLDDTFWKGTLSEENTTLPQENRELIFKLNKSGIVNSICSKNDYDLTKKELVKYGVWDSFVFPSINWDSKAKRIKAIIEDMQLRDENVLFLDDNTHNLEEARFYLPKLMVASDKEIPKLIHKIKGFEDSDPQLKRLRQYKVLESKTKERTRFDNDNEFLHASKIKVTLHKDCSAVQGRLLELINRTNQLNYTKKRLTLDELEILLKDKDYDCRYMYVKDRFGDYGITGFYALKNNELEHFLFSCRIMGMGVEQYIYEYLGFPKFDRQGETTINLKERNVVTWINARSSLLKENSGDKYNIIAKGPCDISQTMAFFGDNNIVEEFTYVANNGMSVEGHNHTYGIIGSLTFSQEVKDEIKDDLIFVDENYFDTKLFNNDFDVFVYSLHTDANLGVYKKMGSLNQYVAFGEAAWPLTDEMCWAKYIEGEVFNSGVSFNIEFLKKFSTDYEFVGRISPEDFYDNLRLIRSLLSEKTLFLIINGSELIYENNRSESYSKREEVHKEFNSSLQKFVQNYSNTHLIDVNKFIVGQESYTDNINHYVRSVYYKIAKEIKEIIEVNHSHGIKVLPHKLITLGFADMIKKIAHTLKG